MLRQLTDEEKERLGYYYGLRSRPHLVARSSTFVYKERYSMNYPVRKQLKRFGMHPLSDQWDTIAQSAIVILDSKAVKWTSIDAVRIGYEEEYAFPILWIAVRPKSLSREDGLQIALQCKQLLDNNGFLDIHCEIREAERFGSGSLKLMEPAEFLDPRAELQVSLTATLGTSISTRNHAHTGGTFGFYVSSDDKLFGVTARHVIFPPDQVGNEKYEYGSANQPRQAVTLPGDGAWAVLKAGAEEGRHSRESRMDYHHRCIQEFTAQGKDIKERSVKEAKEGLKKAERELAYFEDLIKEVNAWRTQDSREMGHAFISPPIGVDPTTGYMIDWCLYEIKASKIDYVNFLGNAIDLGNTIGFTEMTRMLNSNIQNQHKFSYPLDRQLSLHGVLPIKEMTHPQMLDEDGNPCLVVLKRGGATGVTVGIANEIFSYTCSYFNDGTNTTAKEWAILDYSRKIGVLYERDMGPFSERGDSGALIVDSTGRMGGLLTGGSGRLEGPDITYATPVEFLLGHMEEIGKRKFDINVGPPGAKQEELEGE